MVKPCSRNKNSPLVRLQNKYERYGTENNVLSGRGLARRPLSARRVHIKMTSHVAQCIHNTSYCAARELCRLQIWTKRYREHFTVLVIWTLVYREHVPRTFCQGFVPRTYMNGLLDCRVCSVIIWISAKTSSLGAFTLLTSRFLKSRHFDPTIYTCAKNCEVSVSRNFAIFWLVVRMCDHRLQCMHSCMQRMQYAWGPRISIHVSKSARSYM